MTDDHNNPTPARIPPHLAGGLKASRPLARAMEHQLRKLYTVPPEWLDASNRDDGISWINS